MNSEWGCRASAGEGPRWARGCWWTSWRLYQLPGAVITSSAAQIFLFPVLHALSPHHLCAVDTDVVFTALPFEDLELQTPSPIAVWIPHRHHGQNQNHQTPKCQEALSLTPEPLEFIFIIHEPPPFMRTYIYITFSLKCQVWIWQMKLGRANMKPWKNY